ncbi:MAG TPA: hypothetical protein VFS67_15710 [Polyangiaceae bacterium]|nr:hypothetical protein [Polyangiaceae bacterium]
MTLFSFRPGLSSLVVLAGAVALACSDAGGGADRYESDTPSNSDPSVTPAYGGATTTNNATTTPATGSTNTDPGSQTNEGNPNTNQVSNGTGSPATSGSTGNVDGASGLLGSGAMGGTGNTTNRYAKADVTRDGKNYFFMANGWGPGFQSQTVSWNGTSFTVTMNGMAGPQYQPASYPTMFCGVYSDSRSKECGLPKTLDSISSLRTGWSWDPNGNDTQQYNAAYDIWVGNGSDISSHSGFLMVWYREPVGQQPAGQPTSFRGITVQNVPGTWDIWTGQVGGKPIINWVRAEGQDTHSMEFDIMDFVRDAKMRNLNVPGTTVLSVAVGFEMWQSVTNLQSKDFYVDVK